VTLVRTDVSEERSVSIIRVTRISELGTTLAVTSNRRKLRRKPLQIAGHIVLHAIDTYCVTVDAKLTVVKHTFVGYGRPTKTVSIKMISFSFFVQFPGETTT
jgi:hypothetical protein